MRKAFTLIELLVVVSIIALLVAILLPVLSKSKYAARHAICQSNLHQISTAMTAYATDNDGFYPSTDPPGIRAWSAENLVAVADYFGKPANDAKGTSFMNPAWQCPQGVIETYNAIDGDAPRHGKYGISYYSVFPNTLRGIDGGFYRPEGGGVWDLYPNVPTNMLQGLDDTMKMTKMHGISGLEYTILASDLCVVGTHEVGGGASGRQTFIMSNHILGGNRVSHPTVPDHFAFSPLYVGSTDGLAQPNYVFTDGSVQQYSMRVEDIGETVMNLGKGPTSGGFTDLFPLEWAE